MTLDGLDALDHQILHALQENARKTSSGTIADRAGVSASTVRNRINRLEEEGIITGYHADVDYERAGYQLHTLIVCTAPVREREELAAEAMNIEGVVHVKEIMTGEQNVLVSALGTNSDDLSRIARDLDELGLVVVDEDIIRNEYAVPYSGFDVSRSD